VYKREVIWEFKILIKNFNFDKRITIKSSCRNGQREAGFPDPEGHSQPHQVKRHAEAALVLSDVSEAVP